MNTFIPIKSNTKDTKQVIINKYNDLLCAYNNVCNSHNLLYDLKEQNSKLSSINNKLTDKVNHLNARIEEIDKDRTDLDVIRLHLQDKLDKQNKINDELAEDLNKKDNTINKLTLLIKSKEDVILNYKHEIDYNVSAISSLKKRCKLYKNLFMLMIIIVCLMFIIMLVL